MLPGGRVDVDESTSANARFKSQRPHLATFAAIAAAQAGNAVEFYDFVVYVFLAPYIGRAFFGAPAPGMGLLLALAVFGAGFAARPLGALVLARLADRHGRRRPLIATMWLMTVSTVAIACLPTWQDAGMLATASLVGCRLVQGFCFGAEVGPSIAWLAEVAPKGRRGLYCAGLFAGQGAAVFAAGIVCTFLTALLTHEQMQQWGWRVPFAFAAVATPLAIVLRQRMPESPVDVREECERPDAGEIGRIAALTIAILGGTVANYVCTYLPTHAAVTLGMKAVDAIAVSMLVGIATLAFGLLGGWASDCMDRRRLLLASRLACGALAVPLFAWLGRSPTPMALSTTAFLLAAANAFNGGALFPMMADAFPRRRRATSIALVYAIGVALFGGSTQFVVAWLARLTGSPTVPGWYLMATSGLAFMALWFIDRPVSTRDATVP